MEFKGRLRSLRSEKGVSTTALAAEFGKSDAAVRMWETGKSKPDIDTLIKLAEYFECTTDYLLGLSGQRNQLFEKRKSTQIDRIYNSLENYNPKITEHFLSRFTDFASSMISDEAATNLKEGYMEVLAFAFRELTASVRKYAEGNIAESKERAYTVPAAFNSRLESIFGAPSFVWKVKFVPQGTRINANEAAEPTIYQASYRAGDTNAETENNS